MRLDHVSYACESDGLDATAGRIAEKLGVSAVKGGNHPRFGTRNKIIPLLDGKYIEVVEVLEHPAAENQPFGQAVRARSEAGGGWMGWCVSVKDLAPFEQRLGRESVPGNRRFPDGQNLSWRQIGIKGLIQDPQVPYLLRWDDGTEALHPSRAEQPEASLTRITLAGSSTRLQDWLGVSSEQELQSVLDGVDIDWVAPNGTPGVLSVTFESPSGLVTI
jgi:hypothetical protein